MTNRFRKLKGRRRRKKYKPPFDDRNKAGERICALCGRKLKGRRRRWCSDDCWELAEVRSGNGNIIRDYLAKRDQSICQTCGADCRKLKEILRIAQNEILEYRAYRESRGWKNSFATWAQDLSLITHDWNTWEADHIIPLSEGGTHHEDNLQTLCIQCHRADTKALMGRLAEKRKPEIQMSLF